MNSTQDQGFCLGVVTGQLEETITEKHSEVMVRPADKPVDRAAVSKQRRLQWMLELTRRTAELADWCMSHPSSWVACKTNGVRIAVDSGVCCSMCQKLGAKGTEVVFSKTASAFDRPNETVLRRHDDYHLGVALTAKHNEEWSARCAARKAKERAAEEKLLKGIVAECKGHKNERRKGGRFTKPVSKWNCGHRKHK